MIQIKIFEGIHGVDSAVCQAIMSFTKFEYVSQIIFCFKVLLIAAFTTLQCY